MNCKYFKAWLWAVVWCVGAVLAQAQNYTVDRTVIAGGGGTSAAGAYAVTGTLAQTAPGKSSGGGYAVEGGFWSVAVAVQTPGAPFLTVTQSGGNIIISWPADADGGFVLESTTAIAQPASWQNVGSSPVINGANKTVTVPVTQGYIFYRLRKP